MKKKEEKKLHLATLIYHVFRASKKLSPRDQSRINFSRKEKMKYILVAFSVSTYRLRKRNYHLVFFHQFSIEL